MTKIATCANHPPPSQVRQVLQDDQDDQDSKMTDKCYPGTQCTITSTTKTIQEGSKESPASHRDARAPRVATKAQDFLGTEVRSAREILELRLKDQILRLRGHRGSKVQDLGLRV